MRILLIEDDLVAARGVSLMLRSVGAVVDHADTGEEGLELARHYDYDIVVLDLMLPDIEGFEVVRRMRISRNDTPVLILSGLSRPQVKVKGLGLGADDFITKPFDKAELLARMQAIVRRSKGFSQPSLRVGPLLLNLDSHEVAVDGQAVHLTGKEYAILELLVLRKGMVLTKEAFLNHLYGGMDEPEMKIIDVFICKLRKKLAMAGADNLIGTVWGRGYMIREPSPSHTGAPSRSGQSAHRGLILSQHPAAKQRQIDIAAADHHADALARHAFPLRQQRGEWCGAGALHKVVRIGPIGADRRRDRVIGHGDDARSTGADDGERAGIRLTHCHAVGMGLGAIQRHHVTLLEGTRIGRRTGRLHADDLRPQAKQISHPDRAAYAGAETDRHIQRIEQWHGAKQLQRICRHALHQIRRVRRRELQLF